MTPLQTKRIETIDLLKGIVMVLMALDHTRDYFYRSINLAGLTDPSQTTLPIFFTRWITHFCAPTFSFLAGISAFMVGKRKTKGELSGFLLKRGLWLIVIELTIVTFAWYFDFQFRNFDLAVIWVLGASMIFLAAMVHLPMNVILVISCLLITGHNLLDSVHFEGNFLWSVLHEFSSFQLTPDTNLNVIYPVIPWIGVMALGYYIGHFYDTSVESRRRQKLFNTIGVIAVAMFVFVRWTNIYGNPTPWVSQDTAQKTIMGFLNVHKYPPSLLYLLMTLGAAFLFLANTEHWKGKVVQFFSVFGRVPFFYYVLHLYLIRLLALFVAGFMGYGWDLMVQTTFEIDMKDFGFNLGIVYLVWIGIVLSLYPLCKWFDNYKSAHKEKWWLSYL